jgi:hypothetical protein
MKPYGVIRRLITKYLDKGDCQERGASSKYMKMKSKHRQLSRRYFARKERANAKKQIDDKFDINKLEQL